MKTRVGRQALALFGSVNRVYWPHSGYFVDTGSKLGLDSGSLTGYGVGSNWAQPTSPVGPHMAIVWIDGPNWAWLSGPFRGYGVDPNWAPANSPR